MPNEMIERIESIIKEMVTGDGGGMLYNCNRASKALYSSIVEPLEKELTKSKAINKELVEASETLLNRISDMTADAYRKEVGRVRQALTNACEGEG